MATPTFHPHDVKQFPKASRTVITLAGMLGWTVRWANPRQSMAVLISETGDKKINVPRQNLNQNRRDAMVRQIVTHTSRDAIDDLFKGADLVKEPEAADLLVWLTKYLPAKETPAVPIENVPLPFTEPEPETKPETNGSPLVIDTRPATVFYADGHKIEGGYPSKRVVERVWSDGHVDYICSEVGCGFTALTIGPVTSHNNFKHHRDNFRRTPAEGAAEVRAKEARAKARADADARQVLDRIRELVGGDYRVKVMELEVALAAANARADAAEGDLKALRDLLGKY